MQFIRLEQRWGYKRAVAIALHQLQTPLSKRRFNVIKQMSRANKQAKKQSNSLINYLRSLILLESYTETRPKLYLFKPLIALKDSHLKQSKVGWNILDNKYQPVIDVMNHGKRSVTNLINNHKKIKAQILTLNTEFKPRYSAEDNQTTNINVHAQGLGFTTQKYTKNEQRHIESIIKHKFCDATEYSPTQVLVSCPKFTLRLSQHGNDQLILNWTDITASELKYPLLNKHKSKAEYKWKEVLKYNLYTGKQTRVPVLTKQVKQARNDYYSFKYWKYNKVFIFACDNAVHHNLKWSLHFNQRANNNYHKVQKLILLPLSLTILYYDTPMINNESDRKCAIIAMNRHQFIHRVNTMSVVVSIHQHKIIHTNKKAAIISSIHILSFIKNTITVTSPPWFEKRGSGIPP